MHFRYSSGNAAQPTKDLYLFHTAAKQCLSQCADLEYKLETAITQAGQRIFPTWVLRSPLPEPRHLSTTHLHRKEKSFARSLHSRVSELWRSELLPAGSSDSTSLPSKRILNWPNMTRNVEIYFGLKLISMRPRPCVPRPFCASALRPLAISPPIAKGGL